MLSACPQSNPRSAYFNETYLTMGAFTPPVRNSDEMIPDPLFWIGVILVPISTLYHVSRITKIEMPSSDSPRDQGTTADAPEVIRHGPIATSPEISEHGPSLPLKEVSHLRTKWPYFNHTYNIVPRNKWLRVPGWFWYLLLVTIAAQVGINLFWRCFWFLQDIWTSEAEGRWRVVGRVLESIMLIVADLILGFVWFVVLWIHYEMALESLCGIFVGPRAEKNKERGQENTADVDAENVEGTVGCDNVV